MNFDFAAILVYSVAITGAIWLFDMIYLAPDRKKLTVSLDPTEKNTLKDAKEGSKLAFKEPIWVEYAKSFFPVLLIVLVLRSFIVEPFRIPSGSMMPTLLVGDFILVNKFAYGIRLPLINRLIYPLSQPQQGDVVVFRFPQDPRIDYIKRLVGVPGDVVGYHDKSIYVNGNKISQIQLGNYTGIGSGSRATGASLRLEQMASEHPILVNPFVPDFGAGCDILLRGDVVVPPGHYFVMGDNRDNSNDSRCWGFVPDANLVGKAFMVWMNWDWEADGIIAWGRIGQFIK